MMLRQTGISYMSEIYDVIYIVDLLSMELIPAGSGEHSENEVLRGKSDIARFFNRLIEDVSDRYKDLVRTFVDLDTLPDRLDGDSIVCEYISESRGWCQARFFAMERRDDKKPGRAVFTIRIIHDEKLEMDRIEQQLSKEASDKAANIILYHNISPEINDMLRIVNDRASRIETESQDELIKSYAADIVEGGRVLSIQINKILGSLQLSAGLMKTDNIQYSFRKLIEEVIDYTSDVISKKDLNLETDISPRIPDGLYGDHNKLMTITSYLILNAVKFTEKGSIRFSVFGKEEGDKVHLLFSIKDTGKGFREEDVEEFAKQSFDPDHRTLNLMNRFGLGISLMDGMLVEMGSELKLISACGEGSEFYYEIEQTVMDHTPIGKIEY